MKNAELCSFRGDWEQKEELKGKERGNGKRADAYLREVDPLRHGIDYGLILWSKYLSCICRRWKQHYNGL